MADTAFDLFVIGAGSAGVRAARMSAGFGARVAIAEAYRPGGTCVIRGCIPKKLLVYAAHYREDFEDARAYGWTAQPEFSWPTLIANKNREIAQLEDVYRTLLKTSGVRLVEGRARLLDAHTVEVAGRTYTAAHILVATGGWPTLPAIPGIEHCITSNEALELPDLPRRVLVVGGGYVAAEFTGIFHGVGSEVILAYRGEQILRGFDLDVRQHLHQELLRKGIDIRLGCDVTGIERRPDGALEARLVAAGASATVVVDAVMYATGRHANTAGLGLESAGVELRPDGAVIVDEYSRSTDGEHLCRGRRDAEDRAHASRHPRRRGRGHHAVRRRGDACRSRQRAARGVQPAAGRCRRPQRGAGARAVRERRRSTRRPFVRSSTRSPDEMSAR